MSQIDFAEPAAPEPLADLVSAQTPDPAHLPMIMRIRSTRLATIAGGAAIAALCASPAAAGEDVLVWPRSPGTRFDDVDPALRAAGHRPRDFAGLRARMIADSEADEVAAGAAFVGLEQALTAARGEFLAQRYDAMIAALLRAEAEILPFLSGGPGCSDALWELQFQLGLAYTARASPGDQDLARARFALALALDPDRRPVAALYGPDVGLAFVKTVDEQARKPARPVRVAVAPADATLTVDCRPLAPQAGLRPGLHYVHVDAPGHRPHASLVTLADTPTVERSLPADPARPLGPWWTRGALDPTSASARAAVQALAGPVSVIWLDAADHGHVARRMHAGQLVRTARADTAADAAVQALASPSPARPTPQRPPRRRTALALGLAGAALGSLALGLGLGLGLRDPAGPHLQLVVR